MNYEIEVRSYPCVAEVIISHTSRGSGKDMSDPCRTVIQVYEKDGRLIAENDPCVNPEVLKVRMLDLEQLLGRVLKCDANARILNGAPDLREAIMRALDPEPAF